MESLVTKTDNREAKVSVKDESMKERFKIEREREREKEGDRERDIVSELK